jgi:hypothetical protein
MTRLPTNRPKYLVAPESFYRMMNILLTEVRLCRNGRHLNNYRALQSIHLTLQPFSFLIPRHSGMVAWMNIEHAGWWPCGAAPTCSPLAKHPGAAMSLRLRRSHA